METPFLINLLTNFSFELLSIIVWWSRALMIYYYGDDPVFGMYWHYYDEDFHTGFNLGGRCVLTGILVTLLLVELYILSI